jgi:hypothetical protein
MSIAASPLFDGWASQQLRCAGGLRFRWALLEKKVQLRSKDDERRLEASDPTRLQPLLSGGWGRASRLCWALLWAPWRARWMTTTKP